MQTSCNLTFSHLNNITCSYMYMYSYFQSKINFCFQAIFYPFTALHVDVIFTKQIKYQFSDFISSFYSIIDKWYTMYLLCRFHVLLPLFSCRCMGQTLAVTWATWNLHWFQLCVKFPVNHDSTNSATKYEKKLFLKCKNWCFCSI